MLAEGQSCIYEDGRVERKRREAITVVPVWGSEGLASSQSEVERTSARESYD